MRGELSQLIKKKTKKKIIQNKKLYAVLELFGAPLIALKRAKLLR